MKGSYSDSLFDLSSREVQVSFPADAENKQVHLRSPCRLHYGGKLMHRGELPDALHKCSAPYFACFFW